MNNQTTVSLVTGAATGIGLAIAFQLAKRGDTVILNDVAAKRGQTAVAKINEEGRNAVFIEADIAKEADVIRLHKSVLERFGRLDYAVNNAGVEGELKPTGECTTENWNRTIDTNLRGVFFCLREQLKIMQRQQRGAIVNLASVAGKVGFAGLPAYCASKGGVIQLTKAAALEYATQGIRVNALCPGVIKTEMVDRITNNRPDVLREFALLQPMERCGEAKEVAAYALWLCSENASFVTGDAINVDGGFLAR